MKSDRSAALLLMGAAILGLVIANSPFGPAFLDFKFSYIGFEELGLKLSVEHWVSDLLLATFLNTKFRAMFVVEVYFLK